MNKKTVLIILGVLILCACFVVIVAGAAFFIARTYNLNIQVQNTNQENNQNNVEDNTNDINPNEDQTFDLDTFEEEKETEELQFKAAIPVAISNNEELELAFNTYVSEVLVDSVDEFSEDLTEAPSAGKYTFESNYEVMYQNDSFVSLRVLETSYYGGAHPSSVAKVINYDLQKNEPLEITDMFENSADFRNALSTISRETLITEFGSDFESEINLGTQPDLGNFQAFNFTDERFIITFQEYQVGPYALGVPYVEFDWSEISGYLKDGYFF